MILESRMYIFGDFMSLSPIFECQGLNSRIRNERPKKDIALLTVGDETPNDLAERDIRPAKVKQKISNCVRTFSGAEIYTRIEGFVSTARKHNRNVFSELCTTFEGQNFITG